MNEIVKERFPSRAGEHHIGTIVTVIVDGFDYYTAKSTKDMFSLWDLTIFHPNNKTPPKSVVNLAKECFSRIRNVPLAEYTNSLFVNIIGNGTSHMFQDKNSRFKNVGAETGDNPAFKFISSAMMVHVFNRVALLETNPCGHWNIVQKMDDIVSNMITNNSVSVGHKKHLSVLPPLFIHCWDTLVDELPSVVTVKTDGSPDLSKMVQDGYEFLNTCEQRKVGNQKRKQQQASPQHQNSAKKVKPVGKNPLALQVSANRRV